jgi:hypothetical protein
MDNVTMVRTVAGVIFVILLLVLVLRRRHRMH